jgi:PleD family two-component response regulator
VGLNDFVARYDGEEFAIILTLYSGADQSLYKAKMTGKNKTVIHTAPLKEAK